MPLRLSAPIVKDFVLYQTDEEYGNTGDPTTVTFKQASEYEDERREAVFAEITRILGNGIDEGTKLKQYWTFAQLRRMEVFLTMVGCNIQDENGESLFKFKNSSEGQYLNMSEVEFARAWGKLKSRVVQEIHAKCLEVNIDWAGPLG